MRKIKFRGKCVLNNEWVYGYYAPVYLYEKDGKEHSTYCIVSPNTIEKIEMLGCGVQSGLPATYEIEKETLGQYIGLKDINGTKIFEGDIVEVTCKYKGKVEFENCGVVEYKGNSFELNIFTDNEEFTFPIYESVSDNEREDTFIVIGNIYDDKDLF